MFMKRTILSVAVASVFGLGLPAQAQLMVTDLNSLTPEDLVNLLLAPDSGITFSNVIFVGDNVQGGSFSNGLSAGLDFDDGIALSSGNVNNLPLPIGGGDGMSENLGGPGDPMLNDILPDGQKTTDAAVLRFDFIPKGDRVSFSYVFGSSEYNEFVNTDLNDVFAFFVNDLNYALVPGTVDPITVNTVNCGQNDEGPATPGMPGDEPIANCNFFNNNRTSDNETGSDFAIDHGGFTDTFSFVAPVIPNQKNTMYLAIADTSGINDEDRIVDSSVFIKQRSLRSNCGTPGQPPCNGNGDVKVPEPSSLAAIGLAAASLIVFRRRKQR
jgi:hypothetical protein